MSRPLPPSVQQLIRDNVSGCRGMIVALFVGAAIVTIAGIAGHDHSIAIPFDVVLGILALVCELAAQRIRRFGRRIEANPELVKHVWHSRQSVPKSAHRNHIVHIMLTNGWARRLKISSDHTATQIIADLNEWRGKA